MKRSPSLCLLFLVSCFNLAAGIEFQFETIEIPDAVNAAAMGINNHEIIVGYADGADEEPLSFLWENGSVTLLDLGLDLPLPTGINDAGVIVGSGLDFESFSFPSFTYQDDALETFFYPGSLATLASGINNQGDVVGVFESLTTFGSFVKEGDGFRAITALGFDEVIASGINDAGTIVGAVYAGETSNGYIWNNEMAEVFSHPDGDSELISVNNSGMLVGGVFPENEVGRSFVFDGRDFIDVAFPGADETIVWDLNDAGTLVGSYFRNDQEFAFIARPIPEPDAYGLIMGSVVLLPFSFRRAIARARCIR